MTDFVNAIDVVQRRVGGTTLPSGDARTVILSRTLNGAIDDVWDACTNPERIPRWFLPVTGDLRVGGRYQLEGQAGGTIERCEPPKLLKATWEYGGDVSWVELHLTATSADRTRFELHHTARVDDERWAQFGPGAVGVGWDLLLAGLDVHLRTGQSLDPAEVAAWSTSDEGRRFMTLSSQQWALASIAYGTEPSAAEAAGARTTAFYTGSEAGPG